MAECDRVGRREFVQGNGYGYANTYLVRRGTSFYDPKALIGVAHGQIAGREKLRPDEFDATETVSRLRSLGYTVIEFNGLWWVNQGSSYKPERDGGFVWAPQQTKAGRPASHHVAVSKLRIGQRLVHYAGAIRAVGMVAASPETRQRPAELSGEAWGEEGYFCRIEYRDVVPPIPKDQVPNRTATAGPFDVNGNVKQGYLFAIEAPELFPLLSWLTERVPDFWNELDPSQLPTDPTDSVTVPMPPDELHDLVQTFSNVVLEGVPGTGKSFAIERLASEWTRRTGRELLSIDGHPFASIVLHPSTSYEDFLEGLRPKVTTQASAKTRFFDEDAGGGGAFAVDDGFFLRICAEAARNPAKDVLVLLDELNRCNVSSVFGDLLLTLEGSRRARFTGSSLEGATASEWTTAVPVQLPYSGRRFFVPDNVYVVATTNTTDRSVAPLDAAIRRRFAFLRLEPDVDSATRAAKDLVGDARDLHVSSCTTLRSLNVDVLGRCLGPDAMLGQSYLFGLADALRSQPTRSRAVTSQIWQYSILPQLLDGVRAYGAEGLLSSKSRDAWFTDHGLELDPDDDQAARTALTGLDDFLFGLGHRILVEGTGLARGARLVQVAAPVAAASTRLDAGTRTDVDLDADLASHEDPCRHMTTSADPRPWVMTASPKGARIGIACAASGREQLLLTVAPKLWRAGAKQQLLISGWPASRHVELSLYELDLLQDESQDSDRTTLLEALLGSSKQVIDDEVSWDSSMLVPDVPTRSRAFTPALSRAPLHSETANLLRLFSHVDLALTDARDLLGKPRRSPLHRPLLYRQFLAEVSVRLHSARRGYRTVHERRVTIRGRAHRDQHWEVPGHGRSKSGLSVRRAHGVDAAPGNRGVGLGVDRGRPRGELPSARCVLRDPVAS